MKSARSIVGQVEKLESRRLLAADIGGAVLDADGTLTVTGTSGNDDIILDGGILRPTFLGNEHAHEQDRLLLANSKRIERWVHEPERSSSRG